MLKFLRWEVEGFLSEEGKKKKGREGGEEKEKEGVYENTVAGMVLGCCSMGLRVKRVMGDSCSFVSPSSLLSILLPALPRSLSVWGKAKGGDGGEGDEREGSGEGVGKVFLQATGRSSLIQSCVLQVVCSLWREGYTSGFEFLLFCQNNMLLIKTKKNPNTKTKVAKIFPIVS